MIRFTRHPGCEEKAMGYIRSGDKGSQKEWWRNLARYLRDSRTCCTGLRYTLEMRGAKAKLIFPHLDSSGGLVEPVRLDNDMQRSPKPCLSWASSLSPSSADITPELKWKISKFKSAFKPDLGVNIYISQCQLNCRQTVKKSPRFGWQFYSSSIFNFFS
ncbi:hypothetical protein V6N11_015616 [Hibiscus sabdariffa]|uniref:Uncharacterized protein n=1 Tax=Hibiscus sabdariffa TaxID=183260 RepID=A0ABR2TT65_9ROSI